MFKPLQYCYFACRYFFWDVSFIGHWHQIVCVCSFRFYSFFFSVCPEILFVTMHSRIYWQNSIMLWSGLMELTPHTKATWKWVHFLWVDTDTTEKGWRSGEEVQLSPGPCEGGGWWESYDRTVITNGHFLTIHSLVSWCNYVNFPVVGQIEKSLILTLKWKCSVQWRPIPEEDDEKPLPREYC